MANSNYVGLVTCALCGNENATVHQQQTGTKKGRFYYRCYTEINGTVMSCGTIQCIGQTGQIFINANMRPIGQSIPELPSPRPIAQQEAPEKPPEAEIEPIGQPEPLELEGEPIGEEIQDPIVEEIQDPETVKTDPAPRRSVLDYLING